MRLVNRVLVAGALAGVAAGASFWLWQDELIALFTSHASVVEELHSGVWIVLVVCQPLNGVVWVQDGLMYASAHFAFIRNVMCFGFLLVFAPLMGVELRWVHQLWAIWLAKGAMNVWRCCTGEAARARARPPSLPPRAAPPPGPPPPQPPGPPPPPPPPHAAVYLIHVLFMREFDSLRRDWSCEGPSLEVQDAHA